MRKFKFHFLGLVHLPCSPRYNACAYTQKNIKLAKMLSSLGHEVVYYGAEGSDVACSRFVQTHTLRDLRQDYGPLVAQVFPKAEHHECIFHALQNVERLTKEVYGDDYAESHPEAEALKRSIYKIFEGKSKRTAQKRYVEVLALREEYARGTPSAVVIFDFLERHWPKLVNGIESDLVPTTNNTVELVIRRFDQHYQNFCGFESIQTAQLFLGVFEKMYRLTPFSDDAQPRLRGKCPLQLAGYDIRSVPMASICAGWSPDWPILPAPGTDSLVPSQ